MSWEDDPIIKQGGSGEAWHNDPVVETPTIPEALGHSFVNNLPLGGQAAAVTKSMGNDKGYSQNLEDWNKQTDLDKSAHPIAYGTGATAGAVGTGLAATFIPGVAEAPILSSAVLGAANAAGNTDVVKHPVKAGLEATGGAALGAGTGALAEKFFPSIEGAEAFANKKAIQSVEMPSNVVGPMEPSERTALGQFIQENGLVGRDKAQVLEHARDLSKQFGEKIGEIADSADTNGLHADSDLHMSKISDLLNKAQQFKGSANREAKSLARDYTAGASDLVNLSDNPTWGAIQNLKEQYGKLAFKSNGEIKSEGAKDTYFALKDMLSNIAEKAQSNPNLATEYKQALSGYSRMQPIESGLEKAVDSELRGSGSGLGVRGAIGLIKKLPGPVRAVAGPVAVASGHPLWGLAAALPELTNSALQSKAASAIAPTLPGIRQGTSQAMIDYLESKFGGKKGNGIGNGE